MEKFGKFIVSASFVLCFATAIALIIDVCGYVRTTGEVVAVEATSTGDYNVTYKFQTNDGECTAYSFVKNKPQIGDSAVIRYERRHPLFIKEEGDFMGVYIAIALAGVVGVCFVGNVIRNKKELVVVGKSKVSRLKGRHDAAQPRTTGDRAHYLQEQKERTV